MKKKMIIHWDQEGDYLEVRFGKSSPSYYEDVGDDIFERKDEKTNEVTGYAIFNVLKRKNAVVRDIEVELPMN